MSDDDLLSRYSHEQLSLHTWKVVEQDPTGQLPFMYVIMGVDKCVLIDTGAGSGDYRSFVSLFINHKGLPFLVINTHVHFDHVGGNHLFAGKPDTIAICMGSRDQSFIANMELNSLAMAHPNCQLQPFQVTKWLHEGDLIYLDDSNQKKETALEVIHTPGHTPDSISIYSYRENRLFVGDNIYPFTTIHLDCIGSKLSDYCSTIEKLLAFCSELGMLPPSDDLNEEQQLVAPSVATTETNTKSSTEPTPASMVQNLPEPNKSVVLGFLADIGLNVAQAVRQFDVINMMAASEWLPEVALEMYVSNPDSISVIFPPMPEPSLSWPMEDSDPKFFDEYSAELRLSCGHVEANLRVSALHRIYALLLAIQIGSIEPTKVDGDYEEYDQQSFNLMIHKSQKLAL